jgi:uncharacterized delta-60 repeat protein
MAKTLKKCHIAVHNRSKTAPYFHVDCLFPLGMMRAFSMSNQTVTPSALYFASALLAVAGPGDPDAGFDPKPDNSVTSTALLPDGQILIGGVFDSVGGEARGKIARIDPEGVVDALVLPPANGNANSLLVMDDGKIIIGGSFTTVGGFSRNRLARLNAGGEIDSTFNPNINSAVYSMAMQADGKLVVAGGFTGAGGSTRNRVLRFNTNDSLDTFNPNANDIVRSVAILPAGGMVIGGNFTSVGGMSRNHLARIFSGGAPDPGFNPNVNGNVYCVALQPDGNVIIGGTFSSAGGAARTNIARIRSDGTADPAFSASANDVVRNIAMQADGRMIIGGNLTAVNGVPCGRMARLNADGTIDPSFSHTGTNGIVSTTALDGRGQLIAGGDFTIAGTVTRSYLARFENQSAVQALTLTGNDRVLWQRSGTCPETHRVTFELSAGNGTWSALGSGTRIAEGWELTGLNLPPGATVRARARVVSGLYNGSSGLIEATTLGPLENWRLVHFGTAENTGPGADTADPDSDGLENLVEFAFGLNPLLADAATLPQWEREDDDITLHFSQPPGVSGITWIAEYNTDLGDDGWQPIANVAEPPQYTFYAPAGTSGRLFLRVRVVSER